MDISTARENDFHIGDHVRVLLEGPAERFKIVGLFGFGDREELGAVTFAAFELETAQELFGAPGLFDLAYVVRSPGVSVAELRTSVADAVGPTFEVKPATQFAADRGDQIVDFLNLLTQLLLGFALIGLVVGAFIIFNTFSILVSQRVRESALLRALGASKKQVTRSVLVEAFLMAIVGSTLGLLLGLGLSRALAAVFRAIGLDISGDVLTLNLRTVIAAYVVGIVVTMVAALVPARRASKVSPVAALRDDLTVQEKGMHRRLLFGTIALVLGGGLVVAGFADAPGSSALWIGAGAVIWVITVAVMAPVLGHPVLVACRAVFGRLFGTPGRLAGENALRNPRRTGATASALMIGLAVVSAVGVLAASTDKTNAALIDQQFRSDFLVQSPTFQSFPTSIGDQMEGVEGVATVSRQQFTPALIGGKQASVSGIDESFDQIYQLDLVSGTQALSGDEVLLTEDVAAEHSVGVGDTLAVAFPGGKTIDLKVAGIFESSYATGSVTVPMSVLEQAGLKRSDVTLSINVVEGADLAAVQAALDRVVEDLPIVSVQDKVAFTETTSGQINQLLAIIYALLALAVIIAVIGIVNTLGLSVLERTREIGLLRAVGLSRRKLRRMVTLESVAIALLGALLGMGLGLAIGVLLRQSLSEDLTELALPVGSLIAFLAVAVIFGVLAAIVPAVRASRMKVLDAIATE